MLRPLLLHLSHARWARNFVTRFRFARRAAARFVAGETLDEAITAVRALNAKGLNASLDHLGENVTTAADATRATEDYLSALDQIAASGIRSNVSLKLTQLGLEVDETICKHNLRRILEKAQATQNFVRIDMESTAYTGRTLAVFRALHREFNNLGLVLQAYLYRTEKDLLGLAEEKAPIRLCKGAYDEPPDKAFPRKADVDTNYLKLARNLLDHARAVPPAADTGRYPPFAAIATHDEKMIVAAKTYAETQQIPRDYFEFQMLYGIRRDLQEQLAAEGYRVRIYVPYGTEWYPYFMRRLAERPANLWFFVSQLVRG
jgi:proline dehydrogenase